MCRQQQLDRRLLSTEEAAQYLSMSTHWLKTSRFRPELDGPSYIKMGRSVRYDINDLDAWISERRLRGTHEAFGGAS